MVAALLTRGLLALISLRSRSNSFMEHRDRRLPEASPTSTALVGFLFLVDVPTT